MKKLFTTICCICLSALLFGCSSFTLSKEQKEARDSCIDNIENDSSFSDDFKENINKHYVSVETLPDDSKDAVWVDVEGEPDREQDYWVFTIGDPSGQYYARIVYTKETNSVIGYIPLI